MKGWLVAQLPRAMCSDRVVHAFAEAAEGVAETVRDDLDALVLEFDTHLASPEMLLYLGTWLGSSLDQMDSADLHRRLLRQLGKNLPRRGTKAALSELLTALTGGDFRIDETGGVFGPGDPIPPSEPVVRVRLNGPAPIDPERLKAILARELPIGVQLDLE